MSKIEIPLSKTKILLLVSGSILFVIAGLFFFLVLADEQTRFNPILIKGVGILSVLFFGATGISTTRKLFDNKIGLILDENGITDNSSGVSVGQIKWSDITEIKMGQVSSTKFLLIYVANLEYYLQQVSGFKRKMMQANSNMYGTPLSMTSNGLKCSFEELEELLREGLNKYKSTNK